MNAQQYCVRKSLDIEREITELKKILYGPNLEDMVRDDDERKEVKNKIKALERDSDYWWNMAKRMNDQKTIRKNYENLANAVVKQTVFDYEALISGTKSDSCECSMPEVLAFAKETNFTKLDLFAILMKIKEDRKSKFVPYVRENLDGIASAFRSFKRKRTDATAYNNTFPYRCALCGGALKPDFLGPKCKDVTGVGCMSCRTYVYLKDM